MKQDKTTALIHHPYRPPDTFESAPVGVHKASTVIFKDTAALRSRDWRSKQGYTYGLHGTPTTFTLEERIATLDGGTHCVLAPSGLAAITLVHLALLKQGDEVLLPDNAYGPAREHARAMLAGFGIEHRLYDPMDPATLVPKANTRLVWIEAPGSVTMEFPDMAALAQRARATGAVVAFDTTWAGGIAYDAFEHGADLSVHALTKYPSGGADVLMGSVTSRDAALHETLLLAHMRLGIGIGANDAEFVLRSLPSLAVRYAAHDAAARELAHWLGAQPHVSHVLHPALAGSPGHLDWARACTKAAGLFSIVIEPSIAPARVDAMLDRLRLFRLGYSWGGPVSLAVPYDLKGLRAAPRWPGTLVRFSIGLEGAPDLRADLDQAWRAAFG